MRTNSDHNPLRARWSTDPAVERRGESRRDPGKHDGAPTGEAKSPVRMNARAPPASVFGGRNAEASRSDEGPLTPFGGIGRRECFGSQERRDRQIDCTCGYARVPTVETRVHYYNDFIKRKGAKCGVCELTCHFLPFRLHRFACILFHPSAFSHRACWPRTAANSSEGART